MHPIERLRYVARSGDASSRLLVRETAGGLAAYGHDRATLLTSCRQMVSRQPRSARLLWLAAEMLAASDPREAAYEFTDLIEHDPTAKELAYALPDGAVVTMLGWPETGLLALHRRGDVQVRLIDAGNVGHGALTRLWDADVEALDIPCQGMGAAVRTSELVVLEADAVGPSDAVVAAPSLAAAVTAREHGIAVWLVVPEGVLLPQAMFDRVADNLAADEPWYDDQELISLSLIDQTVGPDGLADVPAMLRRPACPSAVEIFG